MRITNPTALPHSMQQGAVQSSTLSSTNAGNQSLLAFSVPAGTLAAAGNGVGMFAMGAGVNNANAKSVTGTWGGNTTGSQSFTVSTGVRWRAFFWITKTSANNQRWAFKIESINVVSLAYETFTEGIADVVVTDSTPQTVGMNCFSSAAGDVTCDFAQWWVY